MITSRDYYIDAGSEPKEATAVAKTKGVVYNVSGRESDFTEADYNLTDVAAAYDVETYFRIAVGRLVTEIWKNGWEIVGRDQDAVRYIRRRIRQFERVLHPDSPQPIDDLLEDLSRQLVTYSNSFMEKIRNEDASGGAVWTRFDGKELKPIAAIKILDATSMLIKRLDNGTPTKYQQEIPGAARKPEWAARDILHSFAERSVGLATGTPFVVPSLDDIRALRSMEQNVEILVFQHAVPLYHVAIGIDGLPGRQADVDELQATLGDMPASGALITTNRVKIEVLGAEGEGVNVAPYLEYFKKRVLAGLRLGAVAVGEGGTANRSTASTINAVIQDVAKYYQKRIKMTMDVLIEELLMEGGFVWDAGEVQKLVWFFIPEIDVETKIAKENHYSQMWQDNVLTSAEVRREMGRDPFTEEEWEDTYWAKIGEPKALIQAIDEQFVKPAAQPLVPGSKAKKVTPTNKSTATANRPTNQYGTRGAPKLNKDFLDSTSAEFMDAYPVMVSSLERIYGEMIEDVVVRFSHRDGIAIIKPLCELSVDAMLTACQSFIDRSFTMGVYSIAQPGELTEEGVAGATVALSMLREDVTKDYLRFSKTVIDSIEKAKNIGEGQVSVRPLLDAIAYRIDFMSRTQLGLAFNIGAAEGAKMLGDNMMDIVRTTEDECESCARGAGEIDITTTPVMSPKLPPFHSNCSCKLQRKTS